MKNVTFVMLKPDAIDKHLAYTILQYFRRAGIEIDCFDVQTATKERISVHYGEHFEKLGPVFAQRMLDTFVGKTVVPVILKGGEDIIEKVREIVGATEPAKAAKGTIRGDWGDGDSYERSTREQRVVRNLIHASDSPEAVRREAKIWLPDYLL